MSEQQQDIELDSRVLERLKKKIILQENNNLKTKEKNDIEMVKWIKDQIEEEVKCSLRK